MPQERRQLIFETDEFVGAIREYHYLKGDFWVGRTGVADVTLSESPDVSASITFDGEARTLVLSGETIAAALIVYCINHKIPLPADGVKSVRLVDGAVELSVAMRSGPKHHGARKPDLFRLLEAEFLSH